MKKITLLFSLLQTIIVSTEAQWQQTSGPIGFMTHGVRSIAFNGNTTYIGTKDVGILSSNDNGNSWATTGLSSAQVFSIAVNPPYIFAATGSGIYVSSNNGATFSPPVFTGYVFTSIAFSGSMVYAVAYSNRVYKSNNNGMTWVLSNTGLPNYVYTVTTNGTDVFLGTEYGVYLSSDSGATWIPRNTGITTTHIYTFAINGSNIFAGGSRVHLSTNNGVSWTQVANGIPNGVTIETLAANGTDIFAGTFGVGGLGEGRGIYKSSDNGANWFPAGLEYYSVFAIGINGTNIFACSVNGVSLSTDNTITWTPKHNGFYRYQISSLYTVGNKLFAQGGAYLSTDGGTSWAFLMQAWHKSITNKGDTIFTGDYYGWAGTPSLKRSANCINWSNAGNGLPPGPTTILSLAAMGNMLFAGTENGVYKATGNGNNWAQTTLTTGYVMTLEVMGNKIFAGFPSGAQMSPDSGVTWLPLNLSNVAVTDFVVKDANLFAATDSGVYLSIDSGIIWTAMNNGLPANNLLIKGYAISGNNIFAASAALDVYLSTDNGGSWNSTGFLLSSTSSQVEDVATDSNYVFAATTEGVWRRSLSDFTTSLGEINNLRISISIFPNPATTEVTINFGKASHYDVQLRNTLGEVLEQTQTNSATLSLNISGYTKGIYFIMVTDEAGNQVVRKVVKI